MITVAEALSIVALETRPAGHERVAIEDAVGRILAEDVVADMDLPPFDRSQMDGFAIRSDDVRNTPVELKIVGESAAGRGWHHEMRAGEAVRIMTGAPVPAGADTVQKVELTSERDHGSDPAWEAREKVTIFESIGPVKNIVRRGAEIRKGERVISAGERVTERTIAVLAAFGYSRAVVSRRPRVSILTTGSEVVDIDRTPGADQIRNSNSAMLRAMVASAGGSAKVLGSSTDDLDAIRSAILEAASVSDLIVTTGGVSVGKYDLTKAALAALGAEICFDKLKLKPGKPTVFAKLGDARVFGLPGNPVSAAVTFYLFVRMALLIMQSARQTTLRSGHAIARSRMNAASERDTYLPSRLSVENDGRLVATAVKWQGSSDLIGFAAADALVALTAGQAVAAGDVAEIYFL